MQKLWNDDELLFLKNNYLSMTDAEIGLKLNRTKSSVKSKRQELGFEKDKAHRKYTFNDVIDEFNKTDYILVSSAEDYVDSATNSLKYMCPYHKDKGIMTISLGHLRNGRGCYFCGRKTTEKARMINPIKNEIECKQLCDNKGFIFYSTSKENGVLYIDYICPKHEEIGIQHMRKGNMARDNIIGCPYCLDTKKFKFSKGEKKIKEVLDKYKISHIEQYRFYDCRDQNMLPFDTYLPDLIMCIEYDGEHHFKPTRFNGASEDQAIINHQITIKHDNIKNEYCKTHNIPLLRIPYYQFNDIEKLVVDFINKERKMI